VKLVRANNFAGIELLQYTSGSTGVKKRVTYPAKSLANMRAIVVAAAAAARISEPREFVARKHPGAQQTKLVLEPVPSAKHFHSN
jgi:acyl-CoA synthetase (AMP-forming)/AMP-acid ligase II